MANSEIEIELDLAPIRYRLEVDDVKKFNSELGRLKSFIATNDEILRKVANETLEYRRKNEAKLLTLNLIECRLPGWYRGAKMSLSQAVAILMYFVDMPINSRHLTDLVNRERSGKKKDLRNVSKQLTSKGKGLYGYTSYDRVTQTYVLNAYGKKWVENTLLPRHARNENENNDEMQDNSE